MRIAITSSDVKNPYAALMALALIEVGHTPVAFLINYVTPHRTMYRYAKYYGWYRTWLRLLHPPKAQGTEKYIIDYLAKHKLPVTSSMLRQVAHKHNIRLMRGQFGKEHIQRFVQNNVDVVVNAGGGLFPLKFIQSARRGVLNIHMGRLPDFRGVHTFEWSLWYRQPFEITAHWIAAKIDMGDILLRQTFVPQRASSLQDIKDQSIAQRVDLMLKTIQGLDSGNLKATAQVAAAGKQYYAMHPQLTRMVEALLAKSKA